MKTIRLTFDYDTDSIEPDQLAIQLESLMERAIQAEGYHGPLRPSFEILDPVEKPETDERPEEIVVRLWEPTEDGDASAEGILKKNPDYSYGSGPEYTGYMVGTNDGSWIYATIN